MPRSATPKHALLEGLLAVKNAQVLNATDWLDLSPKSLNPLRLAVTTPALVETLAVLAASKLVCVDEIQSGQLWASVSDDAVLLVELHIDRFPLGTSLSLPFRSCDASLAELLPALEAASVLAGRTKFDADALERGRVCWDLLKVHDRVALLEELPRTPRTLLEAALASDDLRLQLRCRRALRRCDRTLSNRALRYRRALRPHVLSLVSPFQMSPVVALGEDAGTLATEVLTTLMGAGFRTQIVELGNKRVRAFFRYWAFVVPLRLSSVVVLCTSYPRGSFGAPAPFVAASVPRAIAADDSTMARESRLMAAEGLWLTRLRTSRTLPDASSRMTAAACICAAMSRIPPLWHRGR